ncbi:MAG: FAD-dependent oxidoreductase [Desulfobacterales bacterium]
MEKHSDVFVIGGGIIGLASAYYLAQAGKNVRLLDQDTIGLRSCSKTNTSSVIGSKTGF